MTDSNGADDFKPALSLYSGKVMHARLKPVGHRFSYKMSSILIDIDRFEEATQAARIFSVNKPNLVSFYEKDFGAKGSMPLRRFVDSMMKEAGLEPAASVQLLCYPRVLGYAFNPISVYYCADQSGKLTCVIYEVRNTFGESHCYIEPVSKSQISDAGIRQEADKKFYVSPFLDMEMRYFFRLKPPGDDVAVRILETDADGPILSASFYGTKTPVHSVGLAKAVLQTLGLTWKVTAGIHFEALKLWFKGLKIKPRMPHQLTHSFPDDQPNVDAVSGLAIRKAKSPDKEGVI